MSGLAYAIERAYRAWQATQPQLALELWPDDDAGALDGAAPHRPNTPLGEGAAPPSASALAGGATEPHHVPHPGPTAPVVVAPGRLLAQGASVAPH